MTTSVRRVITAKLKYEDEDGLVTRWANDMVIQHGPDHFVISFYEVVPPLWTALREREASSGDDAMGDDAMEVGVPARCVARIVITANDFGKFLDAWNENKRKHKEQFDFQVSMREDTEDVATGHIGTESE